MLELLGVLGLLGLLLVDGTGGEGGVIVIGGGIVLGLTEGIGTVLLF